jgi:hypothetical protein
MVYVARNLGGGPVSARGRYPLAEIASDLNDLAWTKRAYIVTNRGVMQNTYAPGDAPSLFPGEFMLDARRADGEPWTAELVAQEVSR